MAFARHTESFHDGDPALIANADTPRGKGRKSVIKNAREMNAAIKALGERERSPHLNPTVTVRHIEPWSLREKPASPKKKGKRRG